MKASALFLGLLPLISAHGVDTTETSKIKKKPEAYPILKSTHLSPIPYQSNDKVLFECIQRQIDSGEHKFDADGNIIYGKFPTCFETQESLSLSYNKNSKFNCTFTLTDEIYHLFQLYIHEDVPFSCRLPNYSLNGGNIPLTFNLRGNLESSHLDIDSNLNLVGLIDSKKGVIGSINAFSSGTTSQRYIIGDDITFQINNVWYDSEINGNSFDLKPNDNLSALKLVGVILLTSTITATLVIWLLYGKVNKKALKLRQSTEFGIEKND